MFCVSRLFFCVWPSMVLNQRQVSLVVSDWESYLGSLGFTVVWWVVVSVSVFYTTRYCFRFSLFTLRLLFCLECSVYVFIKQPWTLTTPHIGPPILLASPLQTKRRKTITGSLIQIFFAQLWAKELIRLVKIPISWKRSELGWLCKCRLSGL